MKILGIQNKMGIGDTVIYLPFIRAISIKFNCPVSLLVKENSKAEEFLKRAVELMPNDPVVNDHYADALWMLNKTIQARYFWKSVLKIDNADQELKEKISKKLIFGVSNKSLIN